MKHNYLHIALASLLLAVLLSSCVDEKYTTDPTAVLSFSCEKLSFDTLFTSIPSHTLSFRIYNHNKKALNISSIRLNKGQDSYFRFNLDGRVPPESNCLQNVEIKGKDSLFVFVEMTVNPNGKDFPVFYADSLTFVTNGVTQQVSLEVYGQDAIVYSDYTFQNNTTLDSVRPYLIFGNMYVPDGVTLTLEAGTRLFFHDKANLVVDGNLRSLGTVNQQVIMRTDRFDCMPDVDKTPYDYMPGQWGGVYLQNPHGEHLIDHTYIRGCNVGVVLIGTAIAQPTLTLKNSILHTMTQYGLYSQNAKVIVENCELSNCGTSCYCQYGGESYVVHSTIANYYTWGTRQDVAMVISNYILDGNLLYLYPISSAVVENSIVFGNQSREISLLRDTITDAEFNVVVSNNLLKSKKRFDPEYINNYWANSQNADASGVYRADTVFVNATMSAGKYYNFQLDAHSRARGKANVDVASRYPYDMLGNSRLDDGAPDLGAYEKR